MTEAADLSFLAPVLGAADVLVVVAVVLLVAAIAGIVAGWLPGRWFR